MPRKPNRKLTFGIQRDVGVLGVMMNHLLYDSPVLRAAREGLGGRLRVEIVLDPSDLGGATAFLPDGTSIRLEAANLAYAQGLTLDEHLAILREAGTKVPRLSQSWAKDGIERLFSALDHQFAATGDREERS